MPNWCNNSVTISSNKENIDKFEAFLNEKNGKEWFDFFLPCPEELTEVDSPNKTKNVEALTEKYGHADWYSWAVENWGTKWNCDAQDWVKVENPSGDESSVTFWFDSAWSPPTALYEFIESTSTLNIKASYNEGGMGFVGEFVDGVDECFNYESLEDLEDIPEHLVDEWNLAEQMEMNGEEDE